MMNTALSSLPELLERTVARLAALQYTSDGADHMCGEFPMWLAGPVSRTDHNYLSGYTLLHVALMAKRQHLPESVRALCAQIMALGADIPARYQSPNLTGNWYSGHGVGLPAPVGYPWPEGQVLALHDDYDDTAISALLTALGPFRTRSPLTPELFLTAAYVEGRDALVPKSVRRLDLTQAGNGVYLSWVLPETLPASDEGIVWLPPCNSVELTTVANIVTAVELLGGDPAHPAQVASKAFVNALTRIAVDKLLEGDASYLDFASSYYPRVPFAPLAFLVHNHVTTGTLLEADVVARIVTALAEVDPHTGWRMHGFANAAYWLNCCAWSVVGGLIERERGLALITPVWAEVQAAVDDSGLWPDMVFFHAAHLGDYSGQAYAQALMGETMALLLELGVS